MELMNFVRRNKVATILTNVGLILFFLSFIINFGLYQNIVMKVGAITAVIGTILYFVR